MSETKEGLPVAGYRPQNQTAIDKVNENKIAEEIILRTLDNMNAPNSPDDKRWVAIARTHFELAFMAMNRAVFKPSRITLPSDENQKNIPGL